MQPSQTESPLPKRPSASGGEGGLAARIEAASKQNTPQPMGKGIAMVVLAVLVVAAVAFEMMRSDDKPKTTPATAPEGPPTAPTVADSRFDLPGDLPGATGQGLALALTSAASAHVDIRAAGLQELPKLFAQVPPELRDATRARLLAHLATIGDDTKIRSAVLEAATPMIQGLTEEQAGTARRLSLLAELSLDDNESAPRALVFLSSLPAGARPAAAIESVVLDAMRPLNVRITAAHALPPGERSQALQDLAASDATPNILREALK